MSANDRRRRFGSDAGVILLSGAPGLPADALAYAIEQKLFARGATGVVLETRGVASGFSAARAVADAGLLAIIPTSFALVDEPAAEVELEGRRLLVVRAKPKGLARLERSVDDSPGRRQSAIDVDAETVDEAADRVVAALNERGWIDHVR